MKMELKKEEQLRKTIVSTIEQRAMDLYSLKAPRYQEVLNIKAEYKQYKTNPQDKENPDMVNYQMNTWFAIANTKLAELLANIPKWDFLPYDEDGARLKQVREIFWNYIWKISKTDLSIYRIVNDAVKFGCWFGLETLSNKIRQVKTPKKNKDWGYDFVEDTICEYDGCELVYLPWENVFINGSSLEDSTEAIALQYFTREQFMEYFKNDKVYSFKEEDITSNYFYYPWVSNDLIITPSTKISPNNTFSYDRDRQMVSVLHYWNKPKDEWVVLANGCWINPTQKGWVMGIPFTHKEIPIVQYVDHYVEDFAYGMGEFDITKRSRLLKDKARSLTIEVVKAQAGLITIDPDADFDEAVVEFGIRKFAKVSPKDIGFFAPTMNTNTLQYIEGKVDEDLIIESGVDFRQQLLGQNETAERTKGRTAAAQKRILQNIKYNAYTFYDRLARLRMSNMEMYYSDSERSLPVNGMNVDGDGNVEYVSNGYGLFTMKPEYWKWKVWLIPQIDSMVGDASLERKQKYMEIFQMLINLKNADGSPVANVTQILNAGRGIIDDVINIDKVLMKNEESKDGNEILEEDDLDAQMNNSLKNSMGIGTAGNIPPEQQSGRAMLLPSSPNLSQ